MTTVYSQNLDVFSIFQANNIEFIICHTRDHLFNPKRPGLFGLPDNRRGWNPPILGNVLYFLSIFTPEQLTGVVDILFIFGDVLGGAVIQVTIDIEFTAPGMKQTKWH